MHALTRRFFLLESPVFLALSSFDKKDGSDAKRKEIKKSDEDTKRCERRSKMATEVLVRRGNLGKR